MERERERERETINFYLFNKLFYHQQIYDFNYTCKIYNKLQKNYLTKLWKFLNKCLHNVLFINGIAAKTFLFSLNIFYRIFLFCIVKINLT